MSLDSISDDIGAALNLIRDLYHGQTDDGMNIMYKRDEIEAVTELEGAGDLKRMYEIIVTFRTYAENDCVYYGADLKQVTICISPLNILFQNKLSKR